MNEFPEKLKKYYQDTPYYQKSFGSDGNYFTNLRYTVHKATNSKVYLHCTSSQSQRSKIEWIRRLYVWFNLQDHPSMLKIYCVHAIEKEICVATDQMPADLESVIRHQLLEEKHIRYITYQLLCLLQYAHSAGVIIGEYSSESLFVDEECVVKLLTLLDSYLEGEPAREPGYSSGAPMGFKLYPPEKVWRSKSITSGFDMWLLGCVLGEMFVGSNLLYFGTEAVEYDYGNWRAFHCRNMVNIMGLPTEQDAMDLTNNPDLIKELKALSVTETRDLPKMFPKIPEDGLDLLKKLLQWSPKNRITAAEALKHKFVAEHYNAEATCQQPCPYKVTLPFDNKQLEDQNFLDEMWQQLQVKIYEKTHVPLITTTLITHNIARSSTMLLPVEIWLLVFSQLDELSGKDYTSTAVTHRKTATRVFDRYFKTENKV